jgi:hypothetical protein
VLLAALAPAGQASAQSDLVGLSLRAGARYAGSLPVSYASVDANLVYRVAFLGVGTGVSSYIGLTQDSLYFAPYARVEAGWFYMALGASILAAEPTPPEEYIGARSGLFASTGMDAWLLPIGRGRLGGHLALAAFPSAVSSGEAESALAWVLGRVKLQIGLSYELRRRQEEDPLPPVQDPTVVSTFFERDD